MEKIESFYKEYEDMFEEYLENSRRYLKDNNEKYASNVFVLTPQISTRMGQVQNPDKKK